jgi:thiamine monophosphate synthase
MFIVTINKMFYPEVDYYDTLEEAVKAADDMVKLFHDSLDTKEVVVSISHEMLQYTIKCDF